MEETQTRIYQVIAKLLDGKSRTLNFKTPVIPIISIKTQIQNLTSIPIHQQLLLSNGKTLFDDAVLCHGDTPPSTVHLLLRLRGGKGGFGSLLRGAATKAGQKKTNNFDACRDMSGRRLRHVNAEKKMEEWLAEEKERKLEKVAEEFIKKKAKTAKKEGGGGGDGAEKYVEKYRKDSAKCMEEVEKSVRESLGGGLLKSKRKAMDMEGEKSKKLKIWMGKRKVDDSDSDDTDEEDSDDEMSEENEKSVITNGENQSDSNKEANGESSVGCSSESGSEEEKETVPEGPSDSMSEPKDVSHNAEGADVKEPVLAISEEKADSDLAASTREEPVQPQMENISIVKEQVQAPPVDSGVQKAVATEFEVINSDLKEVVDQGTAATKSDCPDMEKPLNFDDFSSAAEMEALGMERLKSELQERGLKCGGTLQERAARLFLLKTTPMEMLPKKLLAKK